MSADPLMPRERGSAMACIARHAVATRSDAPSTRAPAQSFGDRLAGVATDCDRTFRASRRLGCAHGSAEVENRPVEFLGIRLWEHPRREAPKVMRRRESLRWWRQREDAQVDSRNVRVDDWDRLIEGDTRDGIGRVATDVWQLHQLVNALRDLACVLFNDRRCAGDEMLSPFSVQPEREEHALEISSFRERQRERRRVSSEQLERDRSGELGLGLGEQYLGNEDVEWMNLRLAPEEPSSVSVHPREQPTAHGADCLVRHAIVRRCVSSLSSDLRGHGDFASLAEPLQRRVGRIHICWARVQAQPAQPRPCSTSPDDVGPCLLLSGTSY